MLNEVLLIDDDDIDNETHARVLRKSGCVNKITVFQYADEALTYLKSKPVNEVELIFLDVNMPRMNGFEFINAYEALEESAKAQRTIVMLTTSTHPDDVLKAEAISAISEFRAKPLTPEMFADIMRREFKASA